VTGVTINGQGLRGSVRLYTVYRKLLDRGLTSEWTSTGVLCRRLGVVRSSTNRKTIRAALANRPDIEKRVIDASGGSEQTEYRLRAGWRAAQ
jgi:hypothetical protein